MSNQFFTSASTIEFGTTADNGTFTKMTANNDTWDNGDLTVRLNLDATGIVNATGYIDPDYAIWRHDIKFQYKDSTDTWQDFNNHSSNSITYYKIAPWQISSVMGELPGISGTSVSLTVNNSGNPFELGKYLGTLRDETRPVRGRIVTWKKAIDNERAHHNFYCGDFDDTKDPPPHWTGAGCHKVTNNPTTPTSGNGAMALVGRTDGDGYRTATLSHTFKFRDLKVKFNAWHGATGAPNPYYYSDGSAIQVCDNPPESGEPLKPQYRIKTGNTWGAWQSLGTPVTIHHFNDGTSNTPSTNPQFQTFTRRIHQDTETVGEVQFRFKAATNGSQSGTNYDSWIIDTFEVFATNDDDDDEANSSAGTSSTGSAVYTETGYALGMWKWNSSFTNIYYDNPCAPDPTQLSPVGWNNFWTSNYGCGSNEPYFRIQNGVITEAKAAFLAKAEYEHIVISNSTSNYTINFGGYIIPNALGVNESLINYVEASRCAKIEYAFQNYNPLAGEGSVTNPQRHSETILASDTSHTFTSPQGGRFMNSTSTNYIVDENHPAHDEWSQISSAATMGVQGAGVQRVLMDLNYLTIPDFWESQETYAVSNVYGQARNGDYYLVESRVVVNTKEPFTFAIDTNRNPYSYISAKAPGIDSYDIYIKDIILKTQSQYDRAYRIFWGVYKPPAGGNAGSWVPGHFGYADGWSDTEPYDLILGDRVLKSGGDWYTPNSPYNYYAAAGTTQSNVPIDLDIHIVGWRDVPDNNTTNDDRELSRIVHELKGTRRRGWDFNTQEGIASLVPGINFLMNTDQPNGLWEPSDMRIWADHQDAACHWFKIYVTYKNSDGSIIATDVKTIAGTHTTTNQLIQDSNGEYYRLVPADDFMPSSDVNARFTSIYNNKGYKLQIQIQALNNLNGVISSLNTGDIEVSSLFGVPAFNVGATSAIEIDTNSSGNTATLKYIKPLYVRDGSVTQKAHYYRIDLYKNDSTSSSNLLAKYFKNYVPDDWVKSNGGYWSARWEVYGWTRAANIGQFVGGTGTYVNQIKIGEIPGWDTTYGSTTFLAQLRVLDDDGNFIDAENKTAVFTPYTFGLHSDSGITASTIDELAATPYYNIQTVVKPVTQSNNAFDYATLKVTNSSGAELNFTLPSNGDNIYFNQNGYIFSSDNTGSSLNVISLLNDDRYLTSGNSLSYEIKVWAYGYNAPSSQANAIATKTGQLSVGFWSFAFQDSQVYIDRNTAEECRISVAFTPSGLAEAHLQIAEKFRLRVWKGNATYASTAAGDKKEFTLSGSFFTNAQQYRPTTSGGEFIDIQDILSGSNRYDSNDLNYQITAQKNNGTELHSSSGTFTVPMLTWEMGTVSAAIDSDTFNETVIVVQVDKVNATDSAPYMRNYISEEEVALGTPGGNEDYAWKQYDLVAEDSPLAKTSNSLSDFFYWNIDTEGNNGAATDYVDKTRVTKLDVSARAVYYKNGQAFYTGNHSNRFMLNYTPWWDFHDQNSSVAQVENTIDNRIINIDIQGLINSSQTQNPTHIRVDFERYDTNGTSSLTKTFSSSKPDAGSFNVILNSLYSGTVATSQHALAVRVTALTNGVEHIRSTGSSYLTKTINDMPAEPTVSINLHNTAAMLADNGDEYLYFDLTPEIDNSNFFTQGSQFTIVFEIDGSSQELILPGSMDNDRIVVMVPTGVNTFNGAIGHGAYDYKIYTEYTLARSGNALITGSVRQGTIDKISHKFPAAGTMTNLTHGFNEQGVSQLSFTFNDPNAEYSDSQFKSLAYTVTGQVIEKVKDSVDPDNKNESTDNTFTEAQLDTNALDWTPHLTTEAMYLSDVEINISERYDNKHESVLPGELGSTSVYVLTGQATGGTGNAAGINFPNTVTNSVKYGPFEITMNDISVRPNFGFSPSEGTIENIAGEFGLSGKRIKFKNVTDFDNYYVNSVPYLALGLSIEYTKDGGGSRTTSVKGIMPSKDLIDNSKFATNSSNLVQEISNLQRSGEDYAVDIEINYDDLWGWNGKPNVSQPFTYKLVAFSKEIITKYDGTQVEISGSTDYSNSSTWDGISLTPTEDIENSIQSYEINAQDIQKVDISTDSTTVGKVISSYIYDTPDQSYPYNNSSFLYLNKFTFTQDGNSITHVFDNADSLSNQTASFSRVVSLDIANYDPIKTLELIAEPHVTTMNSVGGTQVTSAYVSTRFFNRVEVNYSDQIIPSFENLSIDNSLNEDNTPENSDTFNLKIFWIYNKDELSGVDKVFSLSQEVVRISRKVKQGDIISSPQVVGEYYMYGITRTSHSDSTKNKFSINDNGINIGDYSAEIDVNKPYVFVYDILPIFRYKAQNANTHTDIEFSSKSVETALVPEKFPVALNSIFDMSGIYNKKHSVEVRWKYRYDESMITLDSLGDSKVNFEIYSFSDELEAERNLANKFKPIKNRLNRNISSWKHLGTVPYIFQTVEDTVTEHRFLVEYDKFESDYNLRIAVLVTVDSELFSSLSHTTSSIVEGGSNNLILDVATTDKEKKERLFMPDEMDITSMRHDRLNLDFTKLNNLEQVPFSVTRKKAKTRLSKKPYTSST